jgi:peptidoglycan/LPS O-acetylase OafA/YrhL
VTGAEQRVLVGRRQYVLLDGVRAIAALMVVGYHTHSRQAPAATLWDGALQLNMGVTVFFVLSGFLLYRPFLAARMAGRPGQGIRRYLSRRLLRVIPAYWMAITVFGLTLPIFVPVLGRDWWIFYGLVQTWAPGRMFDGLSPAWSLSVEMAFYLALPLYVLAGRRLLGHQLLRRQASIEFAMLAAVVVATILARRWVFDRGEGPLGFLVWSLFGHLDWFAGGLALALASVLWECAGVRPGWVRFVERHPNACWGGGLLIFLGLGFVDGSPGDIVHVLSLVVAVLLVAPAIFGDERAGLTRRLLATGPMRWLGLVSFGIFLWNEPLASWIRANGWDRWGFVGADVALFVLAAIASIVLGALSYYVIERPVMNAAASRSSSVGRNEFTPKGESAPSTAAPGQKALQDVREGKLS